MLKVMIVDNEAAIRKGLIHCIRWESLDCTIAAQAEDGIDAIEQIAHIEPDIVISDIRMPGMDGLELARRLSEEYPRIQVIILTGFPDFEYAQRAIEYRVVDFVLKPTSVESLTQAIEKAKARILQERSSQELERALANQSEQTLRLERGMLLHDLIHRVDLSHLFALNRMAQLGLDLTSYYVLRLDIAPLAPEKDESDFLSYLRQSQEVLTECLEEYPVHFVPRGDQMCYAVVCAPESATLEALCVETVDIIGSLPRFSLSIGVSLHCCDPLMMADAAEQAEQAVQFAQYSPERPVMCFEDMPAIPQQVTERTFSDLRLLKSAIENRQRTVALDILRRLFAYMRENKLPVETVRNICVYIHQFCISLLFLPDTEGYLSESSLPALKKLIDGGSPEALEQNMLSFVQQMLDLTGGDTADADGLIRSVKAYIAQHYAEELSLESLAGQVYLSPSYLSKLFKREVGENLSTYVQNVRIEEAKTLLLTTGLKTYEVAERVGIPDPVYFSRIFKKLTGVKPKDFRQAESEKSSSTDHAP
ncbi:response regulator [Butyricicoccus faecihominis]|uniref:response regulator n=1 Tax=Butyricicoccaceae TaxID=3085642 RepID=UPI0024784438|nr:MULTISPECIES: response regulator [Butyricicoccaceae]MCQ5128362.1 response regulator [Butyricicoccus faecihominis]WNX83204.1 response regulator [Agathobaculum sp. NTUH-O15-33]